MHVFPENLAPRNPDLFDSLFPAQTFHCTVCDSDKALVADDSWAVDQVAFASSLLLVEVGDGEIEMLAVMRFLFECKLGLGIVVPYLLPAFGSRNSFLSPAWKGQSTPRRSFPGKLSPDSLPQLTS